MENFKIFTKKDNQRYQFFSSHFVAGSNASYYSVIKQMKAKDMHQVIINSELMIQIVKKINFASNCIENIEITESIGTTESSIITSLLAQYKKNPTKESYDALLASLSSFEEQESIDIRKIDLKIALQGLKYKRIVRIWSNGIYTADEKYANKIFIDFLTPILEEYWNEE